MKHQPTILSASCSARSRWQGSWSRCKRHSTAAPEVTSMALSRPNPTSATLFPTTPAISATTASSEQLNSVAYCRSFPRRTAACLSSIANLRGLPLDFRIVAEAFQPIHVALAAEPCGLPLGVLTRATLREIDSFRQFHFPLHYCERLGVSGRFKRFRVRRHAARQQIAHFLHQPAL